MPFECPDSEEESGDELLPNDSNPSQQSTFSWAANHAERMLSDPELGLQVAEQKSPGGTNSSGMDQLMVLEGILLIVPQNCEGRLQAHSEHFLIRLARQPGVPQQCHLQARRS